MPIAANILTEYVGADLETPHTTASIDPADNALVLLAAKVQGGSISSIAGNGLTWVDVGNQGGTELWRAMGASPSSGTVVITMSGAIRMQCGIIEFTGVDTGGDDGADAIVQTVTNSTGWAGGLTVTLAAFGDANNRPFGHFGYGIDRVPTEGAGFTELVYGPVYVGNGALFNEWKSDGTDTTVDISLSAASDIEGIAVEIKQGDPPPAENSRRVISSPRYGITRMARR